MEIEEKNFLTYSSNFPKIQINAEDVLPTMAKFDSHHIYMKTIDLLYCLLKLLNKNTIID